MVSDSPVLSKPASFAGSTGNSRVDGARITGVLFRDVAIHPVDPIGEGGAIFGSGSAGSILGRHLAGGHLVEQHHGAVLVVHEAIEGEESAQVEIAAEFGLVLAVAAETVVAEKGLRALGEFVFEGGTVGGGRTEE